MELCPAQHQAIKVLNKLHQLCKEYVLRVRQDSHSTPIEISDFGFSLRNQEDTAVMRYGVDGFTI